MSSRERRDPRATWFAGGGAQPWALESVRGYDQVFVASVSIVAP